ncbi:MAG TPA: metallophosphoesterase family protein [Flavitalea sp.]|nr:metallophosphoesterase family protein [Flavitalea sp.]
MIRIGLIADTHAYIDDQILTQLTSCDEIWHAGDFGSMDVIKKLQHVKTLRGVYGNIDGPDISHIFPENLRFTCEKVRVFMTHIGGYPGKYAPTVRIELKKNPAQLFICGHSHICKVMYDDQFNCLHMNPGAAGKQGWHHMRTLIRFTIDGAEIKDCEVVELGRRGELSS